MCYLNHHQPRFHVAETKSSVPFSNLSFSFFKVCIFSFICPNLSWSWDELMNLCGIVEDSESFLFAYGIFFLNLVLYSAHFWQRGIFVSTIKLQPSCLIVDEGKSNACNVYNIINFSYSDFIVSVHKIYSITFLSATVKWFLEILITRTKVRSGT